MADTVPSSPFFPNVVDLNMGEHLSNTQLPQLPMTPTFDSMTFVSADWHYTQPLFAQPLHDSFAQPSSGPAGPSSYPTPHSTGDWARPRSVSMGSCYSQHFPGSPLTEFSYLGPEAETYDWNGPLLNGTPETTTPAVSKLAKRRAQATSRPSKRKCAQAANSSPKKESDSLVSPKPKPKAVSQQPKSSSDKPSRSSSSASSRTSNRNQLRTASRKPKLSPAASPTAAAEDNENDDEHVTPEDRRARQKHNVVEKLYRGRLNEKFEELIGVLPTEWRPRGSEKGVEDADGGGDERRLSKAEVLERAKNRILELERNGERLERENRALVNNVDIVKGAVALQRCG